ncbi:MAG: ABC transporter permease [Planctomycetes bacterium]|nr:ABC transporter permease [Planctomycetota bacterium]
MARYTPAQPRPALPRFPSAVWRVASLAPFQALRGRRLLALSLFVLCPVLAALLFRAYGAARVLGARGFTDLSCMFYLPVILPVTVLFLGAGAIGDEIDNGTFLYLRLRPVGRAAIACGRYLAVCLSAFVLLAPPIVLLYVLQVGWGGAAALSDELPLLAALLGVVLLAVLAYGAFFLLLALLLRHAVIVGLFLVAGWEDFVATVIPSKAALWTISFHLRALLWHQAGEGRLLTRMMRFFVRAELVPSATASLLGLLIAAAALLALACFTFSRKEYLERPGDA